MQQCVGSKHWRLAACNRVYWQYSLELADRKGADFETEKETGMRIIFKTSYSTEDWTVHQVFTIFISLRKTAGKSKSHWGIFPVYLVGWWGGGGAQQMPFWKQTADN